MNFTDNPLERLMKEIDELVERTQSRIPRPVPESRPKPRRGSLCASCPYWNGTACVGFCYRLLKIQRTSGQVGPKSGD